jgi:hypothetical protein
MRIGKRSFASRKRKIAGLCAFVLAGVIGVGAYAFTASNTVEAVTAGAGSAKISGYTVKEPENWTFSETGEEMTKVTFELSEEATDVAAALSEGAPVTADWKDCGATAAKKVTCTFATPVEDAKGDKLSVAAVSHGTVTIE